MLEKALFQQQLQPLPQTLRPIVSPRRAIAHYQEMLPEDMVLEEESEEEKALNIGFKTLLLMAIATSIDALAVGVTFAFLQVNVWVAIAIIGAITFVLSMIGVAIGAKLGDKFEKKAEFIGGLILILIGVKILLEHLGVINF